MRVLVTRARHQSEQFIRALEAKGHTAELLPLLEILPIIFSGIEQNAIIEKLKSANKFVAVSANAANLALPLLSGLKNYDSKGLHDLFAIGPSTAKVLEKEGYKVQIPERQYNSESLLELPVFAQIENQKITLLCGKGGRDYLEQQLAERDAQVDRIELYTRTPIQNNRIDSEQLSVPEVLTAMSGDTVEALDAILNDSGLLNWKTIPLIVPGMRVADIAFERGFTKVLSSQKPTTESLLEVLEAIE